MPKPSKAISKPIAVATKPKALRPDRNARGQLLPGNTVGSSGAAGLDLARARRDLNLMTIQEMAHQFRIGGREAIAKVRKNAPAQFLKMAVLLVPRELEVTHSGGVKGLSDEQIERGIEALEALMAKRAAKPGDDAKVIEGAIEGEAIEVDGTVAEVPSATEP